LGLNGVFGFVGREKGGFLGVKTCFLQIFAFFCSFAYFFGKSSAKVFSI